MTHDASPFFFSPDFCLEMGPSYSPLPPGKKIYRDLKGTNVRTYMCAIFVGFGQFGNTTEGSALRSSINPPYVLGLYKYAD